MAHHTLCGKLLTVNLREEIPQASACMNYVTLLKDIKKDAGLNNTHEIETVMLYKESQIKLIVSFEWPAILGLSEVK